jgi:hypothetical protein
VEWVGARGVTATYNKQQLSIHTVYRINILDRQYKK